MATAPSPPPTPRALPDAVKAKRDETLAVRRALRDRRPDASAEPRVQVTTPPSKTCYLQFLKVDGPREAVLDYTAFLLSEAGSPPDGLHTRFELDGVELEADDRLSLLLSRPLYALG